MKHIIALLTAVLIGYLPSLSFCQSDRLSNDAKDREETRKFMSDMEKTMREMEQRKKRYMERIKPHTKEELKKLDAHLRSIWNSMRAALSKGDIELAVSYFCDRTKDGYRYNFKAMSPQMLRRMAKDMGDIQLIKDNGFAIEYDIQITKGGKRYSFYLLFQKDVDEKWKIDSF